MAATYDTDLANQTNEAIIEAAHRFRNGKVPGQSDKFSPSQPEFVAEVERQEEYIELKARPRIPAPVYRPGPLAPFQIHQQRVLAENADRKLLFEDISFDKFKKLSAANEIPVGGKWVASLGIIYGPKPKSA